MRYKAVNYSNSYNLKKDNNIEMPHFMGHACKAFVCLLSLIKVPNAVGADKAQQH